MLGGRGTINSNTNNIVYESTEPSYESPSKDLDLAHESWARHDTISASLLLVKHHQKKICASDWLLGQLTKTQKEIQFLMTQNQTIL